VGGAGGRQPADGPRRASRTVPVPDPRPGQQVHRRVRRGVRRGRDRGGPDAAADAEGNAHAERWVRTVRVECLDWTLIWNRKHLQRVLTRYVEHYNTGPAAPRHRPRGAGTGAGQEDGCVACWRRSLTVRRPRWPDPRIPPR